MMLLGAHVSIAGGIWKAPQRGAAIGCNTIQIFTKNQMQWQAKQLQDDDIRKFRAELAHFRIHTVIAHDSYLINLASQNKSNHHKSLEAFETEMIRAESLKIPYLVFHPGAHLGSGEAKGIQTIADSINRQLDKYSEHKLKLLFENTAGQGTNLGYRFEQLAEMIDKIECQDRVGVCLDTAHAFAAGYGLIDEASYVDTFQIFDDIIGLDKLMAFHLNDSKKTFGSRVDRHENIGNGHIGLIAFQRIINDPRFYNMPKILETPGDEDDYQRNLDLLKSLINKS